MKEYAFGIDLGGTTAKVGLFTTSGALLEKWEVPTDTSNAGEHILENLADAIHAKMAEKEITSELVEGVGIGVPGPVLDSRVVPIICANLGGWGERNVSAQLSGLLDGMKVLVGNDANVAALGEIWMGTAKGCRSAVMVTLGTGVGGGVIVSFVCFAPADDPQVMMLLTLDEPSKWTGTYVSGGNMVAPVASSVMGEILPYLGIEPSYTAEELVGADKTVPNVVGLSKDAAAERLSANGFSFRTVGSGDTVTDQTPAGGAIVPNSAEIILYLGAEKSTDKCIVPNVVGDSAATANQKIVNAGLIMGVSGATNASSSTVRAISQSIAAGTEVEAGTVVRVQFSDSSVRD